MIQKAQDERTAYHACRTHVSRGMLLDLYQRPRLFEGLYVTGEIPGVKASPAMKLGTAIHALTLEGRSTFIAPPPEHLTPSGNLSEKKATVAWVEEIEASGYIVASPETTERIERTSASVREVLSTLGDPHKYGQVEQPIYWEHISGVGCRCLPDILTPGGIIDLKTTDELDERKIASKIWDLGYWLQAAHYLEGASKHLGHRITKFIFLFAETNAPYRTWMRELDDDYLSWATDRRHSLIEEYQRRKHENDWADPGEATVELVKRPKWAE
jgi:hypothetical protein